MRQLLAFLFAIIVMASCSAQCGYKLWDIVASRHNIESTTMTVAQFRTLASQDAASVGLTYDQSASGNIAIVNALCATSATPATTTHTQSTPTPIILSNSVSVDRVVLSGDTAYINTGDMSPAQVDFYTDEALRNGFIPITGVPSQATIVLRDDMLEFERRSVRESRDHAHYYLIDGGDTVVAKILNAIDLPPLGGIDSISACRNIATSTPTPIKSNADQAICTICDFTGSIEDLWGRYMSMAPGRMIDSLGFKWSSLDAETQTILNQCRRQLGTMVQRHHAPTRTAPHVVKSSLSAAKAKGVWYNIRMWFKRTFRINKCAKRHQKF